MQIRGLRRTPFSSLANRVCWPPMPERDSGPQASVMCARPSRSELSPSWRAYARRIGEPPTRCPGLDGRPAAQPTRYPLSDGHQRASPASERVGPRISTFLGVGTELSFGSTAGDLVRAIRESAQQSGARAGDQIVTRNLNMQPTLRVRPGWPLRVVVHKDIVLRPWGGSHG